MGVWGLLNWNWPGEVQEADTLRTQLYAHKHAGVFQPWPNTVRKLSVSFVQVLVCSSIKFLPDNRPTAGLVTYSSCLITYDSCVLGELITSFSASLPPVRPAMSLLSATKPLQRLPGSTDRFSDGTQPCNRLHKHLPCSHHNNFPTPCSDFMKLYPDGALLAAWGR
jgi:hypothetical protein